MASGGAKICRFRCLWLCTPAGSRSSFRSSRWRRCGLLPGCGVPRRGAEAGRQLPGLTQVVDARATRVALQVVGVLLLTVSPPPGPARTTMRCAIRRRRGCSRRSGLHASRCRWCSDRCGTCSIRCAPSPACCVRPRYGSAGSRTCPPESATGPPWPDCSRSSGWNWSRPAGLAADRRRVRLGVRLHPHLGRRDLRT